MGLIFSGSGIFSHQESTVILEKGGGCTLIVRAAVHDGALRRASRLPLSFGRQGCHNDQNGPASV